MIYVAIFYLLPAFVMWYHFRRYNLCMERDSDAWDFKLTVIPVINFLGMIALIGLYIEEVGFYNFFFGMVKYKKDE